MEWRYIKRAFAKWNLISKFFNVALKALINFAKKKKADIKVEKARMIK